MKSNEDGINIAVFILCTADLRTAGRTYVSIKECWISVNKRGDYLCRETMETLVSFILGIRTMKMNEILYEA